MGFEPMVSMFERAKVVHALDREATLISRHYTKLQISIEHITLQGIDPRYEYLKR
jgi:hypothetical protein